MGKDRYKEAVKSARKELRYAWYNYRIQVKKARLLYKQAQVNDALKQMGVWSKQIPVTYVETKPQKIKVKVGK
jgi:hypothetical protein